MRAPVLAMTWQLWGRHRWGLIFVAGCLLAMGRLHLLLPGRDHGTQLAAILLSMPMIVLFPYIAYVFSIAEIKPRTRLSGFPTWMFTLPAPTWLLVACPMVQGCLAVGAVWIFMALYVVPPGGFDVALWWPALAIAVTLAWLQAADWWPLGNIIKAVIAVPVMIAFWVGLFSDRCHETLAAALPILLPAAYVVALAGVSYARRGVEFTLADWSPGFAIAKSGQASRRTPFASPARALLWLECRRNLFVQPTLVGAIAVLVMLILLVDDSLFASSVAATCLWITLMTAPVLGNLLGKVDVWNRSFRLPAFNAALPIDAESVILGKLKLTALSLFATGIVATAVTGFAALLTKNHDHLVERLDFINERDPHVIPLGLAAFFAWTWIQLSGNLIVGLAGRGWLFLVNAIFYLAVLPNLAVANSALGRAYPQTYPDVFAAILWLGVLAKFACAGLAFYAVAKRGLLRVRTAVAFVALWSLAAMTTIAFLSLDVSPPDRQIVALGVILSLPLVRLLAMPLALEWNRYR